MRRFCLFVFSVGIMCSSCAMQTKLPDRTNDEAMLNFLPYLNQKVAGALDAQPGRVLSSAEYKEIVNVECMSLTSCGKYADTLYKAYDVHPRMLDGMFSVMLCYKGMDTKALEDFSCNEQKVEIRTFQFNPDEKCRFDSQWQSKIANDCKIRFVE